jgi:hypothetical protein
MENLESVIKTVLSMGLPGYAIIAAVLVMVMALIRKLLPVLSMYVNVAIVIGVVYMAFTHLPWSLAIKAVGIFFLLLIVVKIFAAAFGKKGGHIVSIAYQGRDANGNDISRVTIDGTTYISKSNTNNKPMTKKSNSGGIATIVYQGKDANGNDKFEVKTQG